MTRDDLDAKTLREFLDYDQETGVFTWLASRKGVAKGSVAGNRGDLRRVGVGRVSGVGSAVTARRVEQIGECQLHLGDCRAVLPTLPDASVQCCVTSPPYWGLRQYLFDGAVVLRRDLDDETRKRVVVELARRGINTAR